MGKRAYLEVLAALPLTALLAALVLATPKVGEGDGKIGSIGLAEVPGEDERVYAGTGPSEGQDRGRSVTLYGPSPTPPASTNTSTANRPSPSRRLSRAWWTPRPPT